MANSDVIIVRLYPAEPVSAKEFTEYLKGLTITAYDLSFNNLDKGTMIGEATYDENDPTKNRISQHFIVLDAASSAPASVATAVIELNLPTNYKEYLTSDVLLEIKKGNQTIIKRKVDYNVFQESIQIPHTMSIHLTPVVDIFPSNQEASIYLALPRLSSNGLATVDLPSDGTPPSFDELKNAVITVLEKDPGTQPPNPSDINEVIAQLTPKQAKHLAYEIVWNRTTFIINTPPPTFTSSDPLPSPDENGLEHFYTLDDNKKERDKNGRVAFEGSLTSYFATRNATAEKLANFIYSLSAAIFCENQSLTAMSAAIDFPIRPDLPGSDARVSEAEVIILNKDPTKNLKDLDLSFDVPAQYFYAIAASMPVQITPQQRYDLARLADMSSNLSQIETAIDLGVIDSNLIIDPYKAVIRLKALGEDKGDGPECPLETSMTLTTLVKNWLAFPDDLNQDISVFWRSVPNDQLLDLVLRAITHNFDPLINAIKNKPVGNTTGNTVPPPTIVNTVADLASIDSKSWHDFFIPPVNLGQTPQPRYDILPPFTLPGTAEERVSAFITHVRQFFTVSAGNNLPPDVQSLYQPVLTQPLPDLIQEFVNAYDDSFKFGEDFNEAKFGDALNAVVVEYHLEASAKAWLDQSMKTINNLYKLAADVFSGQPNPELQFSIAEALYARGFTDPNGIAAMAPNEFHEALTGTVAYDYFSTIYKNAGGNKSPSSPSEQSFKPVNPDGSLLNCIPPYHLSPFGPVNYLSEMLHTSKDSRCNNIFPEGGEGNPILEDLIKGRCSDLGKLKVTNANLEIPIPLIDLVNEKLEALAASVTLDNVFYNTDPDNLDGHRLCTGDYDAGHAGHKKLCHDPLKLFEVMPEHSSPATPIAQLNAYDQLKIDFSSPILPYSQPLDICRSYLCFMGTSRYATMRRFRKDITEFVIDPDNKLIDFQRHLWRYPVKLDIAIEYLCITPEEAKLLFTHDIIVDTSNEEGDTSDEGRLLLKEVYGFCPETELDTWIPIILQVPEFLKRTGLTYCDFVDLQKSEFVKFSIFYYESYINLPKCEPCDLDHYFIRFNDSQDPNQYLLNLKKLAVFIRLWRKLQVVEGACYSFSQLKDICDVLKLFNDKGIINPDFIRQLAAFQMLRCDLKLKLRDDSDIDLRTSDGTKTGADRTHILALWVPKTGSQIPNKWAWALDYLIDRIHLCAESRNEKWHRSTEFIKLLADNLDSLSILAGFDPKSPTNNWHAYPTHTLRFVEVLLKIYKSTFGIGEILYLFTSDKHLDGDDPFPLQDENEVYDSPLDLPEDDEVYSLWSLRYKLLDIHLCDEDIGKWTWNRIQSSLTDEFDFPLAAADKLFSLGEHFFPSILEASGHRVDPNNLYYSVELANTSPGMWNTPPDGPFHYDTNAKRLRTALPLKDEAVIGKISRIRQLKQEPNQEEQKAVRDLYFLPRKDLAPFALIFSNFSEAAERLIQEEDEKERWAYFQKAFALFHKRCYIIAEHLACHVEAVTEQGSSEGVGLAWCLLKHILADENKTKDNAPWENDNGMMPLSVTWPQNPTGSSFAALLGLVGTGLLGEFTPKGESLIWRETRGPMEAFGSSENAQGSPVPTVIPFMGLTLTQEQQRFVSIRNGFALSDSNGAELGSAQGFSVCWQGILLIEKGGKYEFRAGAPTPDEMDPDLEAAEHHKWRVILKKGQKTWVILSHHWPEEHAPSGHSEHIDLKRGAYKLFVQFIQCQPSFSEPERIFPHTTGFQVKYSGPDSDYHIETIPIDKLFIDFKDKTLGDGIANQQIEKTIVTIDGAAREFLDEHYTSTLRDVRRTYQRAFKALLFAHRFCLSAKPVSDDRQSEIDYILTQDEKFSGVSYYRKDKGIGFNTHKAFFNFNFLPILDNYFPPAPSQDQRADPSVKRKQALFDWWERIFDYTVMREEARISPEHPVWLLFHEAAENHPDDPTHLLRHMGVDLRHNSLVLNYFNDLTNSVYTVTSKDLMDDIWTVRVWNAEKWIRKLIWHFNVKDIREALPYLWASDDPGPSIANSETGNKNLTKFVCDGCFENGEPRRYDDIIKLNNGLRDRARWSLITYLCNMDRVSLPWGGYAKRVKDLSDFLLMDVETGLCEKTSRIEEAISSVQIYIQRCRLGLESDFEVHPDFIALWDKRFITFKVWEACKRREVYVENWIDWEKLWEAEHGEAFRFLEAELRRGTMTVPMSGGLEYWQSWHPPRHSDLMTLQARNPSSIRMLPSKEGLDLLGSPERDAYPSWLAVLKTATGNDDRIDSTEESRVFTEMLESPTTSQDKLFRALPLWIKSAIKLGVHFLRIAAAGNPPASKPFKPWDPEAYAGCCSQCGKKHKTIVDEYYFWLVDSRKYQEPDPKQDANWHTIDTNNPDHERTPLSAKSLVPDLNSIDPNLEEPQSDWHNPEQLPKLLFWSSKPMVRLAWCRIHNGELQQFRISNDGVLLNENSTTEPDLKFLGRSEDSLQFCVIGGKAPMGYPQNPSPGFRYFIATDSAVVLPQLNESIERTYPGELPAYPYFAYFTPGDSLIPPSAFSPALSVAGWLRAHCRFEEALKWYELAFNPLKDDNSWCTHNTADVERFASLTSPEREETVLPSRNGLDNLCYNNNTINVDPGIAQKRSVLLHYVETLLQWGDSLMRRNSPEAFQHARLIFDTALRILGEHPRSVKGTDNSEYINTVANFTPLSPPINPRLLSLYSLLDDRLVSIHCCIDAWRLRNGKPKIDMPFFGDHREGYGWSSRSITCGENATPICPDEEYWCCLHSPYRFQFLIQKALEMTNEVKNLGSALLSAFEKGDGEFLASLRASQERQLQNLIIEIRKNQWREADWNIQALQKTKEVSQTNRRYYDKLVNNGLNSNEQQYENLENTSIGNQNGSVICESNASVLGIIPDLFVGLFSSSWIAVGTKLASTVSSASRVASLAAGVAGTTAGLRVTQAGWDRRLDEWNHQIDILNIEIDQVEHQILAAERRRDVALSELNNHQLQIEHSEDIENFLRNKFTNDALYLYLQQETTSLFFKMYDLALQVAKQAQGAFNYERGYTARRFLPESKWDNLHESLLAGEKLQLALRQMEKSYLDENVREYELTKHISLRIDFPLAFLCLKTMGICEINLPEWMFDLDYPGHFMRRIKNVTLSIPCVVGPYTGVHSRLTLLSSTTRVDPRLIDPVVSCCKDYAGHCCNDEKTNEFPYWNSIRSHETSCCTCIKQQTTSCNKHYDMVESYPALSNDPRIVKKYAATEAIATSSGQNDSGMFELNFRDERYLPFEFAGAVSHWRIELPIENNRFDFDSLSDVVLHLNYTAREGGDAMRMAANEVAQKHLPGNGIRFFDIRQEFPEEWHLFQNHPENGKSPRKLNLRLSGSMFPYIPLHKDLWVNQLHIFFETRKAEPNACRTIELLIGHREKEENEYEYSVHNVYCSSSNEWPCIYHGVINVKLGPLSRTEYHNLGILRFPSEIEKVTRVFLLCGYSARRELSEDRNFIKSNCAEY